jgi:hypothetical protein
MDNYGQLWTILDNYGQFWTILDNYGHLWTIMDIYGQCWTIRTILANCYKLCKISHCDIITNAAALVSSIVELRCCGKTCRYVKDVSQWEDREQQRETTAVATTVIIEQ